MVDRPAHRGMYEPQTGPRIVRPIHANCSDRVRIIWTLPDGTMFDTWHLCPTPEMISAERKK